MKRGSFLKDNGFVLKRVYWLHPAVRVALLVTHTTLCGCTAKPWAEQQLEFDPLEVWTLEE